jgi:hypothetical protein
MLRSTKGLVGFTISASDGDIGRVEALYFDDQHWTVRYFVVDTSWWLTGRRVLVSPASVRRPDWDRRRLPVALTKAQVQASPDVDAHQPISRQFETAFSEYYGIPYYWPAPYVGAEALPLTPPARGRVALEIEPPLAEDRHLRSTEEVRGYSLRATDGAFGHVEDFLVEDLTWRIRYIDVDTRNWWPSKHVLVAPEWIEAVSWQDAAVFVALPSDTIRNAPPYDRARPIDRQYEQSLYAYYGRSGYWEDREAA